MSLETVFLDAVTAAPSSTGRTQMLRHLKGEELTKAQAISAWCFECMGRFVDGKKDCQSCTCPLHPFMAYNPNKRKREKHKSKTEKA